MATSKRVTVEVEGRELALSNLEKVLYPEAGFTKAQVIDYCSRIAPVLVPHLQDRPLTLKRYPNGVDGEMFYEKNCPAHRPEWMQTAKVWSGQNQRYQYYCMAQDLPSLVWVANLASLELHTSLSRASKLEEPSALVFDLDPGPPADVVQCCQVALWLRDIFSSLGLQAFAKTSGSKGMQMYVPLNTAVDYGQTKTAALGLAQRLEREHPEAVVSTMEKAVRGGKVFIDWSQNDQHKTTVNVYSLRARPRPTVSTPVRWAEVEGCLRAHDSSLLVFEAPQVLERVAERGDLFEPLLTLKQELPAVLLEGVQAPAVDPAQRKASWARRREIEKTRKVGESLGQGSG
jgi:bifunctional non-homologous end joining protein LigD